MSKPRVWWAALVVGAMIVSSGRAAWAVPSLQLTFEPSKNVGSTITYDTTTQTTVLEGSTNFVLTTYALDTAFHANSLTNEAVLVLSLDPSFEGSPNVTDIITISVGGFGQVAPTWTWGTPPLEGTVPSTDLPQHGEFPSWWAEVVFTFETAVADVPNVVDGTASGTSGYVRDFSIQVNGLADVHFDLYTHEFEAAYHDPIANSVYKFAPFSHDAEVAGVPEPASLALFSVGGLGLLGARRRRARAGAGRPTA